MISEAFPFLLSEFLLLRGRDGPRSALTSHLQGLEKVKLEDERWLATHGENAVIASSLPIVEVLQSEYALPVALSVATHASVLATLATAAWMFYPEPFQLQMPDVRSFTAVLPIIPRIVSLLE